MQPVDLTTLVAACHELSKNCLPARLEQVYQSDRHTLYLNLRTIEQKLWLLLSWHPVAARLHLAAPPPHQPDTFTFSQQIWHQVAGLALVDLQLIDPWERIVDLQFASRPGDPVQWHLYLEIMGKYSNAILVNATGHIVTAAHQVSDKQSRVRPIQTGQQYELPPALLETIPNSKEPFDQWRDRLSLIPHTLKRSLLTNYRGVSSSLVRSLGLIAEVNPDTKTDLLSEANWQNLWQAWQTWLQTLNTKIFTPQLLEAGYTVIDIAAWQNDQVANLKASDGETSNLAVLTAPQLKLAAKNLTFTTVNELLQNYYRGQLYQQEFQQIYQQITQVLQTHLHKLQIKADEFQQRLAQSEQADNLKHQANLLMAHLQDWQPGMTAIKLVDFVTDEHLDIPLDPLLNAVQNAQVLYKQHQKQKRAKEAIAPLLEDVQREILYLEQVATAAAQLERDALPALVEIRLELIQQGYLKSGDYRSDDKTKGNKAGNKNTKSKKSEPIDCHRYHSPSGFEIWIGRNNYQNDAITFRVATEYDLWFHTQEIPGSHVLLRLEPGAVADRQDLQTAANLAAYYSRARQSEQVPVVFTKPKNVYKPKGAKPGMVIYKQEQVIWAQPQVVNADAPQPIPNR